MYTNIIENYYFSALTLNLNINIVLLLIILLILITKMKKNDMLWRKIFYIISLLFLINIFIIIQSVAIEALLEGFTGLWIGDDFLAYRAYSENFLATNSLNITLYLLFIIILYRKRSIFKSLLISYLLLLIPYFSSENAVKFSLVELSGMINIIINIILGLIIYRYIYNKKILQNIQNNISIKPHYIFIPVFGFLIILIKLVESYHLRFKTMIFMIFLSLIIYFSFFIVIFFSISFTSLLLIFIIFELYLVILYYILFVRIRHKGDYE